MKYFHNIVIQSTFAFFLITAAAVGSFLLHRPPKPLGIDAPLSEPSALRAMEHVRRLASAPRPFGSQAQARAREYIVAQIKKIGVEAEIQKVFLNDEPGKGFFIRNIVARMPGYDAGAKAVCLTAHYDSIPFGPGAGDDASGCAVLLETIRTLKHRPKLRRDTIFVFTDNEEGYVKGFGTMGALAFVTHHPYAKKIGCVMNFDVRGSSGPAYMYETAAESGPAICALAKSGAPVFASSLMPAVYKIMPLGSDFTRFIKAGIPGWNFAFVSGFQHYHNARDVSTNLSPASVQHMLAYALSLLAHLDANMPDSFYGDERQYFNVCGSLFAHYPDSLSPWLTFFGIIAFLFVVHRAHRTNILNILQCAKACAIALASVATGVLGITLITALLYFGKKYYIVYSDWLLVSAYFIIVCSAFAFRITLLNEKYSKMEVFCGFVSLWGLFSLLFVWFMRGGHHLFLVPFLSSVIIFALYTFVLHTSRFFPIVCGVLLVPSVMVWTGVFRSFYETLSVLFSFVYIGFFIMLCGLCVPFLFDLQKKMKILAVPLFISGIVLICVGYLDWKPSPARPEFASLTFAYDADTRRGFWYSAFASPDRWTAQVFSRKASLRAIHDFIPEEEGRYLSDEVHGDVALSPFSIEKISSIKGKISIRLHFKHAYPILHLYANAPAKRSRLNGRELLPVEGNFYIRLAGIPDDDPVLTIEFEQPISETVFTVIAHNYALPPGMPTIPMPDDMMMLSNIPDFNQRLFKSGETIVRRMFRFSM